MKDSVRKYFACPECGNKYKVRFTGARYPYKACNAFFRVPNESQFLQEKPTCLQDKAVKILMVLAVLLLLSNGFQMVLTIRFYRQVRPMMQTAGEVAKYLKQFSSKFE